MCLKTDTVLLQYTFYQFQYFITTCLCLVQIYQKILQWNSFNRKDLMVLFDWDWSCLINKLSLKRSLNMYQRLEYQNNQSIEQLHSSWWSDTADCLTLLRCFPVKLDILICSAALVKKWWCFTITSNLAVTTCVSVNNVRVDLFLKGIFIAEQHTKFTWWLENNFS